MSRHVPVLLNEVIDSLQLQPGMNVIDCTLGDAGHAEALLAAIAPNGKLLGIDTDPEAILRAKQYLYNFGDRVVFTRDNFENLTKIVKENNFGPVQAILLDLGWSSPQFAERRRGFSFDSTQGDEPLDMRYSGQGSQTAADIVNSYGENDLQRIFRIYGEEKLSQEIATEIVSQRKNKKIEKAKELVEIILEVYRKKLHSTKEIPWIGGLHPATKVFQALRIETNRELEVLRQALPQALAVLSPGGRLAVITFHSIEDRIVKHYFQSVPSATLKIINKKPIVASAAELNTNRRAGSAKLRVVEKLPTQLIYVIPG